MAARYADLGISIPVQEVLNPRFWRENYAYNLPVGVDPDDPKDVSRLRLRTLVATLPDRVIRWHLRTALSEAEMKLGIPLGLERVLADPVDDGEVLGVTYDRREARRPYTHGEMEKWFRIDLPSGLLEVERIRAFYYGAAVWEISGEKENLDQVRIEWPAQGILHILPTNFQAIVVTKQGNYGIWHTLRLHRSPLPDFWAVDYVRGPTSAHGGEVGKIEAALADWIFSVAGIKLFSISGLAQSGGLTSTSVGFDGYSRSVSLQASAIYGINSAAEHVLEENAKRIDWKQLRMRKRGLRVRMFSH